MIDGCHGILLGVLIKWSGYLGESTGGGFDGKCCFPHSFGLVDTTIENGTIGDSVIDVFEFSISFDCFVLVLLDGVKEEVAILFVFFIAVEVEEADALPISFEDGLHGT